MSNYQEVLDAPKLIIPKIKEDKWISEEKSFFRQLPELLKTKRGKWVASHQDQVVEIGDSLREVLLLVRKRYPKTEVYIQLVDEKLPIAKMVSPGKRVHHKYETNEN